MRYLFIVIFTWLFTGLSAQIGRFPFSSANVPGYDYTDLVGQWSFDEASGDLLDKHASDDGTVTGADYGVAGIVNDAYDFERGDAGDYVTLGTGLNVGSGDMSVTMWVWVESAADYDVIGGPTGALYWRISSIGRLSIGEDGASGSGTTTTATVTDLGQWVFIAFVYENGPNTVKFWVDAVTETEAWSNTSFGAATNTFGARLASAFSFDGRIDEIYFYDAAISDAIVEYNYNNGNGRGYGQ